MAIKVFTDASSNLFKKILLDKNAEIEVLPMALDLGDKRYLCYEDDIDVEEMSQDFYLKMTQGLRPKTSLVNPGYFMERVEEEIKNGNEVLYVALAGGISGSYQGALMIANQLNEAYKKEVIKVINSKTASFGEGMIALYAYKLVKEGKTLQEVFDLTNEYVNIVRSEFSVDSINYLAQSGRVSKFVATLANVLSIKPLLYGSNEGKIEVTSKCHGRNNALKTLANQVNENIKDKDSLVYIAHSNCLEDTNKFVKLLNEAGINNIEIYFYDLVTGSHVGPGTIAVFYEGINRNISKKNVISSVINKIKRSD